MRCFRISSLLFTEGPYHVLRASLPKQQARFAQDLYEKLRASSDADLRAIAELLATKPDDKFFGETEFELRDMVHHLGAKALETAAEQRKKGGM